ncbi:hypothetical protein [Thalassolituus sp.]|uniref:hypothetical protein n=1 Tax=Thalassolituus sp. TaxID=2030822 RepID=UPI002A813DF0|nr:hypothetical protein [Thalassolituus sp.]|tara:strand:+ start:4164 stop:4565 length:402 start_codon:yes stop_codon:yes gene_type:complete
MIDQWDPSLPTITRPDSATLQRLAEQSTVLREQGKDALTLTAEDLQQGACWIQQSEDIWLDVIPTLSDDTLIELAFFYTQAEMILSGFQAKAKNPAIWIFRYLRQVKRLPEKAVIRELKALTDNRFIPYGSVL